MPAWVPLKLEDVMAVGHPTSVKEALDGDDKAAQRDTFERLRSTVVANIRTSIATCDPAVLDANDTLIPPEWLWYAALWVYSKAMSKVGAGSGMSESAFQLTEDQRDELKYGREQLALVAKCELAVSLPVTPVPTPTVTGNNALPSMVTVERRFTWDQEDGI
jgi:hypothetical protein